MRIAALLVLLAACIDSRPAAKDPVYGTPMRVALSPEGNRFYAAAFDDQNRLYATGLVASGDDQQMTVVRFTAAGAFDTRFGDNGAATVNVAVGGKTAEVARGVALLSDGKVVIAGPIEHAPGAAGDDGKDTDVAVVRFTKDGKLDAAFGDDGIVRLDLSTGVVNGTSLAGDSSWGISVQGDDKIIVVATRIAAGRTDSDFAIVRLNTDGSKDASFGTDGVVSLDVANGVDSSRQAQILSDGRIVVSGYTRNAAGIVSIVLFRLLADGALDATFGDNGVRNAALMANAAEAYDVEIMGDYLVTAGYGKEAAADKVDVVIGKFSADGSVMAGGMAKVDVAGEDDRARDLVALPKGGALIVGSGKLTADNVDAMIVRLNQDATIDTSFGDNGKQLFDLGGPADSFFGSAVSPDGTRAAIVGYKGAVTTAPQEDDAFVLYLSLR